MNGVHDMGGMHGFGPIPVEDNEPRFYHDWEPRARAIMLHRALPFSEGDWTVVSVRYAIERLDPALYLASSYFERWLNARIQSLIEAGTLTQAEFDERLAYYRQNPEAVLPRGEASEAAQRLAKKTEIQETEQREVDIAPEFSIGDAVKTRNMHPVGHTRLPRYARGKQAVVVKYYGVQDFDDAIATGLGPDPQPLYCVRFEGQELWGESAEPNSAVYLDMWESYLESI